MSHDPRPNILQKIDIDSCLVRNFSGFVFLCGGEINGSHVPPKTMRDAFLRAYRLRYPQESDKIILAESINNWSLDQIYPDLLSLENDIAHLSNAIILFVESPGSIAELGAFSCLANVAPKLLVILDNKYDSRKSFIGLGPSRFLDVELKNKSFSFPFDVNEIESLHDEIVSEINHRTSEIPAAAKFNKLDNRHVILLISELIKLFTALRIGEILEYLQHFSIELTKKHLERFLFLLEKLNLIVRKEYGRDHYFVNFGSVDFIRFSGLGDRDRASSDILAFYGEHDKRRESAARSVLREIKN